LSHRISLEFDLRIVWQWCFSLDNTLLIDFFCLISWSAWLEQLFRDHKQKIMLVIIELKWTFMMSKYRDCEMKLYTLQIRHDLHIWSFVSCLFFAKHSFCQDSDLIKWISRHTRYNSKDIELIMQSRLMHCEAKLRMQLSSMIVSVQWSHFSTIYHQLINWLLQNEAISDQMQSIDDSTDDLFTHQSKSLCKQKELAQHRAVSTCGYFEFVCFVVDISNYLLWPDVRQWDDLDFIHLLLNYNSQLKREAIRRSQTFLI
jgi:hypothetical protein